MCDLVSCRCLAGLCPNDIFSPSGPAGEPTDVQCWTTGAQLAWPTAHCQVAPAGQRIAFLHRPSNWSKIALTKATKLTLRRRSGQSIMASDFGSNGPRFESGRGRCVESLDKALPLSQGEAFTLASISYLAILVKYILAKKKKS